jgi:tetratricopeptide (TPR) repeat protein
MKFPVFASFIIFGACLTYALKRNENLEEKAERDFWERESEANSVRKKDISALPYVSFPFDRLPSDESFAGGEIPESLPVLRQLATKKMLNMNNISNTELKLQYGTANLTVLSEYDENYTQFAKNIYELSQALYDAGRVDEAVFFLQEAVSTGTDLLVHYRLLGKIYHERGEKEHLLQLRESAQQLHGLTQNAILRELDALLD